MRLASGAYWILDGIGFARPATHAGPPIPQLLEIPAGVLILVGLWTPYAGVGLSIAEFRLALVQPSLIDLHAILAVVGVSLAMLGPGAWSIDARLFGRQLIDTALR